MENSTVCTSQLCAKGCAAKLQKCRDAADKHKHAIQTVKTCKSDGRVAAQTRATSASQNLGVEESLSLRAN